MHGGQNLVMLLVQPGLDGGRVNRLAPGALHHVHLRAQARGHFHHARAEHAVVDDQHVVAAFHQVDEGGFHAGGTGAGNGEGHGILGFAHGAQLILHGVHDFDAVGIKMTQRGDAHGLEHIGGDRAGAGGHQQNVIQFSENCGHFKLLVYGGHAPDVQNPHPNTVAILIEAQ